MTGPVDLIEVDEGEYIRAGDVHNYSDYDTKNKGILVSASFAILSAFRDGEFIIEGKRVPIERCVNNGK